MPFAIVYSLFTRSVFRSAVDQPQWSGKCRPIAKRVSMLAASSSAIAASIAAALVAAGSRRSAASATRPARRTIQRVGGARGAGAGDALKRQRRLTDENLQTSRSSCGRQASHAQDERGRSSPTPARAPASAWRWIGLRGASRFFSLRGREHAGPARKSAKWQLPKPTSSVISKLWVSAACPHTAERRPAHRQATKNLPQRGTYAELPPSGLRPAALLAPRWRIASWEPEILG